MKTRLILTATDHQPPSLLPDLPLKRRRHKKRAKKRPKPRPEPPQPPPLPSQVNQATSSGGSISTKTGKRKRKRRRKQSIIVESVALSKQKPKQSVLSALSPKLQSTFLQPPSFTKVRSPLLLAKFPNELFPTNGSCSKLVTPQMSPAPPDKTLSLKLLFRSTGDVSQTPLEQLDEFLIHPLMPSDPI